MVHFYLLLVACLYHWYTTTFYWLTVYLYVTLLPCSGSLAIPSVLYYLLLVIAYTSGTLLPSTGLLPIPMILYYHMLAHCLSLWYTTTFYWPTAYIYGTLLPSTGILLIPMVLYYLLLVHCQFLWYSTTF